MQTDWQHRWSQRYHGHRPPRPGDARNVFEIDRCRVIHSAGFRRLQAKTQIFGIRESSFHRTRLTHSIEVASVSSGILSKLRESYQQDYIPNQDLIFTIGLLHDMGHPPFGHGGETALNYMMRQSGGFEGNGQTLRLVTELENLRLSRRTLLGILKYPIAYQHAPKSYQESDEYDKNRVVPMEKFNPPKCYMATEQAVVDWVYEALEPSDRKTLETFVEKAKTDPNIMLPRSLDCSIMDLADDIAYSIHDLEDAVTLNIIKKDSFLRHRQAYIDDISDVASIIARVEAEVLDECRHHNNVDAENLIDLLFHHDEQVRKAATGTFVYYCVSRTKLHDNHQFNEPLLRYNAILDDDTNFYIEYLKNYIKQNVVYSKQNMTIVYGGMLTIMRIFEALNSNRDILLDQKYAQSIRGVCDYIACMTDEDAYKMHERLFGFNTRSIFEVLPP